MTWTAPPTVATGDIYTAAMFNTYTRDNMNHLRVLVGNADPGGSNKALYSTGGSTATWGLLPSAAMLEQKVNQVNPVYTTFAAALDKGSGMFIIENVSPSVVDGPVAGILNWHLIQSRYYNFAGDYRVQLAMTASLDTHFYIRWIINGTPSAWFKAWNANNDGSGSGLDADLLDGLNSGNASGQIPISNGLVNINLNADYLDSLTASNASGQIPVSNGALNTNLSADMVDGHHALNSGGVPISNGTVNTGLNADMVDGFHAGNANGNVPISNGALNTNLNADQLDSKQSGNANGNIPISNGTGNANLNADLLDNFHAGNGANQVPINNAVNNTSLSADMVDGFHAGNGSGNVPISNGTVNSNLNADMVDGLHASAFSLVATQGTYNGNGANSRAIATGFAPKMVIITAEDISWSVIGIIQSTISHSGVGMVNSGSVSSMTNNQLSASDGFNVGGSAAGGNTNASGVIYKWTAFR